MRGIGNCISGRASTLKTYVLITDLTLNYDLGANFTDSITLSNKVSRTYSIFWWERGFSVVQMDVQYHQNRLPLSSLLVRLPTLATNNSHSQNSGPIPPNAFTKFNLVTARALPRYPKHRLQERLLPFMLPANAMSLCRLQHRLASLLGLLIYDQHQLTRGLEVH